MDIMPQMEQPTKPPISLSVSKTNVDDEGTGASQVDSLQFPFKSMAHFVNIQKEGNHELVKHIKEGNVEVAKCIKEGHTMFSSLINTFQTKTVQDLMRANTELAISKEKERLLLDQLNSVSAEKHDLSKRNFEISIELEVERGLKRSKTAELNAQSVELQGLKKEYLKLTAEVTNLRADNRSFRQANMEFEGDISACHTTIRKLKDNVDELNRNNKRLECEKTRIQFSKNQDSRYSPPRHHFGGPFP